jgi:phosphoketolase
MEPKTLKSQLLSTTSNPGDKQALPTKANALTPELLSKMNAYWRAANYLSVGQIYLYDNPLLKEPLKLSHVKPWWSGIGGPRRARTSSMCISTGSS